MVCVGGGRGTAVGDVKFATHCCDSVHAPVQQSSLSKFLQIVLLVVTPFPQHQVLRFWAYLLVLHVRSSLFPEPLMYPCECATVGLPSVGERFLVQARSLECIAISFTIHEVHVRISFVAVTSFHVDKSITLTIL
jgi:hypothetical protein